MLRALLITYLLLVLGSAIVPTSAWGQVINPGINFPNPLTANNVTDVINNVATFIYQMSIPITVIVFLAGAYQFLTAAGDPEKLERARATLLWAAVGFGLVIISFSVAVIVKQVLGM